MKPKWLALQAPTPSKPTDPGVVPRQGVLPLILNAQSSTPVLMNFCGSFNGLPAFQDSHSSQIPFRPFGPTSQPARIH